MTSIFFCALAGPVGLLVGLTYGWPGAIFMCTAWPLLCFGAYRFDCWWNGW